MQKYVSPTEYMESIMLRSVIYAKEDRDVETIDTPNFFIQTPIARKRREEKIVTRTKRVLVDMMVHMDPEIYGPNVVMS